MPEISIHKCRRIRTLAIGTFSELSIGLIYAWSIFRAPLTEIFPNWTPTQVSMVFTISIVASTFGAYLAGQLSCIIKHNIIILFSAALIFVGFLGLYMLIDGDDPLKSITALYVCYGVLVGFGIGLSYNTLIGIVTPWFPERIGFATGILLFGYGTGALLFGSIVNKLIVSSGVQMTFFIVGVLIAVILIVGSFLLKLPPENIYHFNKNNILNSFDSIKTASVIKSYTLKEAIKSTAFWLIFLWSVLLCIGGLLVINSAAPIAIRFGAPALMGLIVSIFNGVGRLIIGVFFDKFGKKNAMAFNAVLMILGGSALTLGALTEMMSFIFIGLPLVGLCYGGTMTILASSIRQRFGSNNYQAIFGVATFTLAFSGVLGPLLSSRLQEISGGEYLSSFIMLIISAVFAIVIGLVLNIIDNGNRT